MSVRIIEKLYELATTTDCVDLLINSIGKAVDEAQEDQDQIDMKIEELQAEVEQLKAELAKGKLEND